MHRLIDASLYDGRQNRLSHGIEGGTADVRHVVAIGMPILGESGACLGIVMDDIDAWNMSDGVDVIMVIGHGSSVLKTEITGKSELSCCVPYVVKRFGSVL